MTPSLPAAAAAPTHPPLLLPAFVPGELDAETNAQALGKLIHLLVKAAITAARYKQPSAFTGSDLPNAAIHACQQALGQYCPELHFRWHEPGEFHIVAFIGGKPHAYAFLSSGEEVLPAYPFYPNRFYAKT